jgi:hypothetical protein
MSTDADYHDETVCSAIASQLKLDPKDVYNSMKDKESHMFQFIIYQVAVNKKEVWKEPILPFQDGRFDEAQFNQLKQCIVNAMQCQLNSIKSVPESE